MSRGEWWRAARYLVEHRLIKDAPERESVPSDADRLAGEHRT